METGAGLLQATSLPFIVAATTIGLQVHAIKPANAAALVAARLFSVIFFPVISLQLLRPSGRGLALPARGYTGTMRQRANLVGFEPFRSAVRDPGGACVSDGARGFNAM